MQNLRHVTGLGWGGDVNVHVNLRQMHNLRHVTGWGWGGDVNVHVNLRHMHNLRHVTGLGWGGDVNVHVNLRHMHNLGHAEQLARVSWKMSYADWLVEQRWLNLANRRKKNNNFSQTCWKSINVPHETHFWEQAPVELRLDVFITILQNLANTMILWTKHHEKSMNYPGSLTAP